MSILFAFKTSLGSRAWVPWLPSSPRPVLSLPVPGTQLGGEVIADGPGTMPDEIVKSILVGCPVESQQAQEDLDAVPKPADTRDS
jgi:hypothetical protein